MKRELLAAPALASLALACQTVMGSEALPTRPPPLAGLEEPLALQEEPRDEEARQALPAGSFTGLYVADARKTLDDMLEAPAGVRVARVVENSPGEAAGIEEDDLLLGATPAGGAELVLSWPSQWRELELELAPGTELLLVYDRAGVEREARLVLQERVRPAEREPAARLREEDKVGVVLRSATEVEAREAGLGPGAGAVVVGLSAESPWRPAGLRFEDLIVAVDGRQVAYPQVVLDAIRGASAGESLHVSVRRPASAGTGAARAWESLELDLPVSRRERQLTDVHVPLLLRFEKERDARELSLLLGALRWRRTPAAWDLRLLWLFRIGGGDSERLEQVAF